MTQFPIFSLSALALAVSCAVSAEPASERFDRLGPSQSDFGGVGLMETPTARMAREGEFSANYMDNEQYRRWSVSIQPYEWLETTFRYTDVRTKKYGPQAFSGDQTYKDKGVDLKVKLLQESYRTPQLAVGVRDIAGTGLFDSEFVAASKRWGDIDFTLGIGWGNMAESANIENPFCNISDTWCEREGGYSGRGGKFEYKNMFHGPAALFGGIEYQTQLQPLRLKLEYDGNDYSNEFAGQIEQATPINIGAVYRIADELDTHLSYQRGNTLMWGVTLRTNFNDLVPAWRDAPRPQLAPEATQKQLAETDKPVLRQALTNSAGFQGASLMLDESSGVATVRGEQTRYRDHREVDERTAVLVANTLPEQQLRQLDIVYEREGMPVQQSRIDMQKWRAQQAGTPLGQTPAQNRRELAPQPTNPQATTVLDVDPSRLNLSWKPQLQQSLGGPDDFYLYQFGVNGDADLRITDNLKLGGTLYWNWFDNLDKFTYTTPPGDTDALPRVRTWIREYVSSSDLLLNNLQLTVLDELAPNWYGQAYGGYLEMMYAGVGSEVLYRPYGARWALGADINAVRQRDWNNTLKLADYSTVTGLVSAYIELPYLERTTAKLGFGRYLAKDVGTTIDLSKRFETGVVVGGFATFTNVSAEEYGEGSFTKGVYFTIPFDLLLSQPTTRTGTISWIPLTRDGGQMVGRRYSLYTLTD